MEKSVKAVLIHHGIRPPKTHNIERLVDLLPTSVDRTEELMASDMLTEYGVEFRYPNDERPVTESQYQEAMSLAIAVLAWAEGQVRAP